jgi:hypothetical protein
MSWAAKRPIRFEAVGLGIGLQLRDRHLDELLGPTVLLADDDVLGDVDQATGEVAGVRGAQRRIGEALAGAVGRDEELEHRQAFHEVGLDRTLDDLALRVGHEAAHTCQLADLRGRATRTGGRHHRDRVERVEVGHEGVADLVGRTIP